MMMKNHLPSSSDGSAAPPDTEFLQFGFANASSTVHSTANQVNTFQNTPTSPHLRSDPLASSSSSSKFQVSQHSLENVSNNKVFSWILELMHGPNREQALLELGKKREQYNDLALILWHSFGVMTCLLQEIVYAYPLLSPPDLSSGASNRVCNALALLQCIASHDSTRQPFLDAQIPLLLYPFLRTTSKSRPFVYLRLTSLGVIGALVKNDSVEVIAYLVQAEVIPLCLGIMESDSELSKAVAIFILQKIVLDDAGLNHICETYDRFFAVSRALSAMVYDLVEVPVLRLLKHVVRCYLRLSDNGRACHALRRMLPEPLRDASFYQVLKDDLVTKRYLAQLLANLAD